MRQIKKLTTRAYPDFVRITAEAYPGIGVVSEADRKRTVERLKRRLDDKRISLYGALEGKQVVGVMRLHDYRMNMRGTWVDIGGVGSVAVDLSRKKEHVAKDMMVFYLEHYARRNFPILILWPFRPDFYHNMGFGLGSPAYRYSIKTEALPPHRDKSHIQTLTKADAKKIADCYNRFASEHHGLIEEPPVAIQSQFDFDPRLRYAGCVEKNRLRGYIQYRFERGPSGSFLDNNLVVTQLIYENRAALNELLAFLRTQADQIDRITLVTHDEQLYYLFSDPRLGTDGMIPSIYHESFVGGVGIMYRVLDTQALFEQLQDAEWGQGEISVKLHVKDSFYPKNEGTTVLTFENGSVRVKSRGKVDVELTLDVAELSSLVVGAADLSNLVTYSLAEISDEAYLPSLTRIFRTEQRPMCLTAF